MMEKYGKFNITVLLVFMLISYPKSIDISSNSLEIDPISVEVIS